VVLGEVVVAAAAVAIAGSLSPSRKLILIRACHDQVHRRNTENAGEIFLCSDPASGGTIGA